MTIINLSGIFCPTIWKQAVRFIGCSDLKLFHVELIQFGGGAMAQLEANLNFEKNELKSRGFESEYQHIPRAFLE